MAGRPRKDFSDRRDTRVTVRFRAGEAVQVDQFAAAADMSPSEYIRARALKARPAPDLSAADRNAVFQALLAAQNAIRRGHSGRSFRQTSGRRRRAAKMNAAVFSGGVSESFQSSLRYALHDHDGIGTNRVGQIETRNLVSEPYKAHREMQTTADAALAIQARARRERGERSGASGSRPTRDCLHYALSWHPEDSPKKEKVFEVARRSLEVLGLQDHQAVIVQHVDRPTPHVHVIVSRCHPETGRTANLFQKIRELDRFCHVIETEQQMIRSFRRAAKYEREQERTAMKKDQDKKPQFDVYRRRVAELKDRQIADRADIKKRQQDRHEAFERKVADVKRQADIERDATKKRHVEQLKEYWKRDAPKMKLELRPTIQQQLMSDGAVMADAIKKLRPQVYPGQVFTERRAAEQDRRAPVRQAEPDKTVTKEFKDKSPNSAKNQLNSLGIEDRYEGALAMKRWHRHEMIEIDRVKDETIRDLRQQFERDEATNAQEWQEHKERFDKLHKDLRMECNIPDRQQVNDLEQGVVHDRFGNEVIDMSGPVEPEHTQAQQRTRADEVRSYVDDYMAGRGRDDLDFEQFYVNNSREIEEEFHRRMAETPPIDMNAPPLEPEISNFEPVYEPDQPEPIQHDNELDWEIGD